MNKLLQNSVSGNTNNVYENALNSFENFRSEFEMGCIWPPPIEHIINFIAYLSKMGYSATTAKTYISGINHKLKINNWGSCTDYFIVEKMLNGMTRLDKKEDTRKPITMSILKRILSVLHTVCNSFYEAIMFKSAFSLAFFGFLRIGEISFVNKCTEQHIVNISDIELDEDRFEVSVKISSSKTDQFGKSTTLVLSKVSDNEVCVYKHLKSYLNIRPNVQGQLFCHLNHKKLTRFQFLSVMKLALKFLNLNPDDFNTHSLRIGAATNAYIEGKSDEEIKIMGRWKSNSFKTYIRIGGIVKLQ